MLNTTPLNTSELNSPGFSAEVALLEGVGAVAVVAAPPVTSRFVGVGGTGAVAATQATSAIRGRTLLAAATASATSSASVTHEVGLSSAASAGATGLTGWSDEIELGASAPVAVVATLYFEAVLFATATASATAAAATASVMQAIAGTGAVSASGAESGDVQNPLSSVATVTVRSVAVPDYEVGGVLQVGLASAAMAGATAAGHLDPTENLFGAGAASVTAAATVPSVRYRIEAQGTIAPTAIPLPLYVITGELTASQGVSVVAAAAIVKETGLAASALVRASAAPRLGSAKRLDAAQPVSVTGVATPTMRIGLRVNSPVSTTSVGPDLRLADAIYGTGAVTAVGAASPIYFTRKLCRADPIVAVTSVAAPVYFTRRNLGVNATVQVGCEPVLRTIFSLAALAPVAVTETGTLRTNLFSIEPDYRTVVVEADIDTLLVDAQEFTLIVTTDLVPMQTFTKQPTEILPYDIDFELWFEGITGGDEIESATCTVVTASSGATSALVIDSVLLIADTRRVKVWTSGGTNGVTYKLTMVMVTGAGRRKEVDFKIKIKET